MPDVIRVLMVISNLKIADGVAKFAMTYYSHLDHTKIHMDFAIYDSENINDEYAKQIKENHSKIFALPSVKDMHKHILYCRKLFQKRHYDIVHDNSLINTIPFMREAAKAKIPVRILHAHATKLGETRAKEARNRILLPLLQRYINAHTACSNAAGECLFQKNDFILMPNVIDGTTYYYDKDKHDRLRDQYRVHNKKIILTVARIAEQKNPFFAINIINELLKKDENIEYWWVGDGPLKNELQQHINKLGLSENVKLLGSKKDIQSYYIVADCFFLPSLFEGLPVSGVEAQTAGLPCVVSSSVTDEMVYTDLVKYVSLQDSIDAWVEALEEQIKRIPERRSYTEELKQSQFSAEGAGERLEKLYREMLSRNMK